jgi:hypothetical protein
MSLGYEGDHGHGQPWDSQEFRTYPDKIVFRQSVPHGGRWPDIVGVVQKLQQANYTVHPVFTWRDPVCMAHSQKAASHVNDKNEALDNIARAIVHCDTAYAELDWTPLVVKYENFVASEGFRRSLHELFSSIYFTQFGVYDANNKWRGLEPLNEGKLAAITKELDNALYIRF